jgi:hypothetical protein
MILISKALIITLISFVVLIGLLIALYFWGNSLQKKQIAQKEQINAAAQPATLFIIDKKIMPMKDANLPKSVMEQAPKRYQRAKVPIVKAKVGPQVMSFICDEQIFDEIPVKREVKARISGIYIVGVKNIRGGDVNTKQAKPSLRARLMRKQKELQNEVAKDKDTSKKGKKGGSSSISAAAGANKNKK